MSSNSGMFSFSQTGPSVDPAGSAWDSSTAEGPQNFFADHGDAEEYPFTLSPFATRNPMNATDDFQSTWMQATTVAGADESQKAQSMCRISSQSSAATSHRVTKSSSKTKGRPRLQAAVSQANGFDMTGNTFSSPDGLQARPMDPSQFMFPTHSNGMTTSPEMLYARMDGMPTVSVFNDFVTAQHVDPRTLPIDFEPSMSSGSPAESWDNLSEVTTPPRDDAWALNLQSSPLTSISSDSPTISTLDTFSLVGPIQPIMPGAELSAGSMTSVMRDDQMPVTNWPNPPASDNDNARDHPLYRGALPSADGLYHCPWEGDANCNHKPEKLKCNYDKFVDSHLKPYRCKLESCKDLQFSSTACLLRHEREAHGMHGHGNKPYPCTYPGCDRAQPGNGFPRKWNLNDHMHRVHNAPAPPEDDSRKDSAKARKRKNSESTKSTSGRKTPKSRKASPPPRMEPEMVPVKVDVAAQFREQWFAVQGGALPELLNAFPQPEDPMVLEHINRAKEVLDSLAHIHRGLMAAKAPGSLPQQSG